MKTKLSLNYNSFINVWRSIIHVDFFFKKKKKKKSFGLDCSCKIWTRIIKSISCSRSNFTNLKKGACGAMSLNILNDILLFTALDLIYIYIYIGQNLCTVP